MELEKRSHSERLCCSFPDYESTKANFDELEKRIDDLENIHYKGVAPIDEEKYHNWPKPPPDTCGNCKKAWRQEGFGDVVCTMNVPIGSCELCRPDKPACPHHDRRAR